MANRVPPRPRKYPKQKRSQVLVDAIQAACLQILQNQGCEHLSTQNRADVAGVNIASVYQYFPNKEAVLASVYDEELKQLAAVTAGRFAALQALSQQSLGKTIAAIIDLEADQLLALYKLNPDFFTEYSHNYDVHSAVDKITQSMKNPSSQLWFPAFLSNYQHRLRPVDVNTLRFFCAQHDTRQLTGCRR